MPQLYEEIMFQDELFDDYSYYYYYYYYYRVT